jgi:hypothetical protein
MGCPSRKVLMSQLATVARLSSRRKYYAYSTLKAPDKGDSHFPLPGDLSSKNRFAKNLPKVE